MINNAILSPKGRYIKHNERYDSTGTLLVNISDVSQTMHIRPKHYRVAKCGVDKINESLYKEQ